MGNEQCCQVPSRSTNFRSTISAPFFFMNSKNSFGVIALLLVSCVRCLPADLLS